jgi:hypothetical protein
MPTIQNIVNATASGSASSTRPSDSGSPTKSMRIPAATMMPATMHRPRNCQRARRSSMSSMSPTPMPRTAAIAVSVKRGERTSSGMRNG